MRIQTAKVCQEENRRWRLVQLDVQNLKDEKADMAKQMTTARQWVDRWRPRALHAEAANRKLHAENVRLLERLAEQDQENDCDS